MTISLFLSSWLPVAGWAGLIFYLSSIPSLDSGLGDWDFFLRKGAHMFEYAVLTLLLFRAFRATWPGLLIKKILVLSALLAVAYAASDEYHQTFVSGRSGAVHDVLIDSIGVTTAILFLWRKQSCKTVS